MKITVQVRDVYGRRTIYPACENATLFALIAGTTTLTPTVIRHIKALGYEVEIEQHVRSQDLEIG